MVSEVIKGKDIPVEDVIEKRQGKPGDDGTRRGAADVRPPALKKHVLTWSLVR